MTQYRLQYRRKDSSTWLDSNISAASMTEIWTDLYERLGGVALEGFDARVVPVEGKETT